ncbi:PTS glucose transporter subunit IIA [Clostridium sp. Sa3CUN1]|uniref:PTS glucose transporter subunit IIA n=1 Tax=Clostridium gallinarum TaxID=2762246 RepID=A0ABR8Q2K7_9CLOT|nr:beta-glucoside-specific PTS transporter subunit IIABC [Clostridium gallinarum]MBD7914653.1 PTS glucose transporter subunit IIA [Clostridium gallinarum]
MKSYRETAINILKNVGGEKNVAYLEHCSTRLRFTLVDDKKANISELKKIDGVVGVVTSAQCQVIIGNEVIEVYDEIMKIANIGQGEGKNASESNKKIGATILDFIVGVFQPLVPVIAGSGILKSLLLLLSMLGVLDKSSQLYSILNNIGEAGFYFLPIFVASTTASKLKSNKLVSISAVAALILPSMTSIMAEGASIFGLPITNINYTSQVFPAILCVLFLAQIEKLFTKISPKAIRIFFVPLMTLLITVPVTLVAIGPLGYFLGQGFTTCILFLYSKLGWVAIAILAPVLPFLISTGMHKALVPYAVSSITEMGYELLYLPASLAHNISEAGACFAVAVKSKDDKTKSTAISSGVSALFGITEPALYSLTIQNKKVLSSVMTGSFAGAIFIGIFAVRAFAAVGPGLASVSMFISEELPKNILYAIIGALISFIVAFLVGFILWKEQKEEVIEERVESNDLNKEITLVSYANGEVVNIENVKDDMFSQKILGNGIAIIPEDGALYAPCDGTIETVFHTNHAIAIKSNCGKEILLHVGIDTVKLEGKYFEAKVKEGDRVKAGDLLLNFDIEAIKREGYNTVIPMVITNMENINIQSKIQGNTKVGKDLVLVRTMEV